MFYYQHCLITFHYTEILKNDINSANKANGIVIKIIDRELNLMKSLKLKLAVLLLPVMMVITACGVQPVMNINNAQLGSSNKATMEMITKEIRSAGIALGWKMKLVKPGHLEGTLYLRKHMAKVDVKFNAKNYSITYKDSEELNYDGDSIHKNYNGWIINLRRAIESRLSAL